MVIYYDFFLINIICDELIIFIFYVDVFGIGKVLKDVWDILLDELRDYILGFKWLGNIFCGYFKEINWNYVEVIFFKFYYILEGLFEYFEEMVVNI